jgi:hypothetical protein
MNATAKQVSIIGASINPAIKPIGMLVILLPRRKEIRQIAHCAPNIAVQ